MEALDYEGIKRVKNQLSKSKLTISLVLDRFNSNENIAHAFRLADAFAMKHIYLFGKEASYNWKSIKRISRSSTKHINHSFLHSYDELDHLNYDEIIALEWTDESIDVRKYQENIGNVFMVLGNEKEGIHPDLIGRCEKAIHIPMYGINSSMNVVMAASIAAFTLLHQDISET